MKADTTDHLQPLEQNLSDQQVLALYHAGRLPYMLCIDNEPIKHALRAMFNDQPLLPLQLNALAAAVDMHFLQITDDGHLKWMLEEKTLLAYFIGRLWCGDQPYYSMRQKCDCWYQGKAQFPTAIVERYFNEPELRNFRRKRNLRKNPKKSQLIDSLILNCKK